MGKGFWAGAVVMAAMVGTGGVMVVVVVVAAAFRFGIC